MKNANLVERTCQGLLEAVRFCPESRRASRQVSPVRVALTWCFAHTSLSSHTATSLSFSAPREPEFPHNDMLAKLSGLGDAFNFFTQICFSIGGK